MPSVNDLILASATHSLALQRQDGSFPPGHNGPWNDPDTPARVTAHWLVLLTTAYRISGAAVFQSAALRAADYLVSPSLRPGQHAFHCCRTDDPLQATNGLIGQAWVMEGLLEAGLCFDRRYLQVVETVVRKHCFDPELGLWHHLGLYGEQGPIHRTLNQQLWFAVMVYRLAIATKQADLEAAALRHFERLPALIRTDGGYLQMLIAEPALFKGRRFPSLVHLLKKLCNPIGEYRESRRVRRQSLGYLSFTLFALARMAQLAPAHSLWQNANFEAVLRRSIAFADERLYDLPPNANAFAYSYNPVGIEMAYVKSVFGKLVSTGPSAAEWLDQQLRRHYDQAAGSMTRATGDPNILAARMYELYPLADHRGTDAP